MPMIDLPTLIIAIVIIAFGCAIIGGIIVAIFVGPVAPDTESIRRAALSEQGRKGAAASNTKRSAIKRAERQRVLEQAERMRADMGLSRGIDGETVVGCAASIVVEAAR